MPEALSAADRRYLAAAIRIGAGGLGSTWPNPSVGAVLLKDGHVIATGRTASGGRPHAEQQVLADAGAMAAGGTLYISLEPCAHHGRTPPCAEAVIAAGVSRVVVGTIDPDPRVSGKGLEMLKEAGVSVSVAERQEAVVAANEGHIKRAKKGLPWITLKLAVSSDGMIGRPDAGQVAISGARASAHVHALRSRYDGILVGSGTVEADDPRLTCRLPGLEHRSPVRIVLDSDGRLPAERKIFAGGQKVLRLVGEAAASGARSVFADHVETVSVATGGNGLRMESALEQLGAHGLTRVMVEGGSRISATLVGEGLVDDIILFRSPNAIGAGGVPALAGMELSAVERSEGFVRTARRRFGEDLMTCYRKAA